MRFLRTAKWHRRQDSPLDVYEGQLRRRDGEILTVEISEVRVMREGQPVDQVIIRRIRVITPGTLVQGPDVPLPIGYSVSIRQRRNTGTPEGYVAFSRNAVANAPTRVIMLDNDSITVRISNFNEAWFDADTANTDFEMMAVR